MEALSKEQRKAILQNRAKKLAEVSIFVDESKNNYLRVARFSFGNETYCIETNFIQEIVSVNEITPLPGAPSIVKGVINIRGKIVAVFNPYDVFQIKDSEMINSNKVIILGSLEYQKEFGILVDMILNTSNIALNEINPIPQNITGLSASYIRGISTDGTIVLDGLTFITSNEFVVNQ